MEETIYNVYAKLDSNKVVTELESNLRTDIDFSNGWTQIDEGTGDKYAHAQGNYLDKGLMDSNGKYNYKFTDDKVIELTEDEKIDLDEIKQNKIQELSNKCNEIIISGFYSDADGTNKLYDFELENQLNIIGLTKKAEQGEIVSYYAKGEACHDYTANQMLQLANDGETFKATCISKYKDKLKPMVLACTAVDEVNVITWDTTVS